MNINTAETQPVTCAFSQWRPHYSKMRWEVWLLLLGSACGCTNKLKDTCSARNATLAATSSNYTWTDDCRYLNECDSDGCCIHKDLMPLKPPEAGGTILIFVISAMANAGGIGGGPIMTALEILLFYFNPKEAIPLSQVIIVAGAIVSFGIRALQRHPKMNRPLCEYHVSLIIIPPILFGATFGVMANKVLPNVVILVMLTLILIWITWITLRNGIHMFKVETRHRKHTEEQAKLEANAQPEAENGAVASKDPQQQGMVYAEGLEGAMESKEPMAPLKESAEPQSKEAGQTHALQPNDGHAHHESINIVLNEEESEELTRIYKRESKQFPVLPCAWIIFITFYVALGLSIRGGKGTSFAGIKFCGDAFKIFFALWSFGLLLLTFVPFLYLPRLKKMYDRLGYVHDDHDIKWTMRNCVNVYFAGLMGGFGGSLLGFGASLLVAPILVQWHVRSVVIAPTAALMTLIGSAISVMQFAESKSLIGDYAGWLAMVAFVGSLTGVCLMTRVMRRVQRGSILVFILAAVLAIAMFLVPIYTLVDIIKKEKDGKGDYSIKEYCE